MSVSQPVALHFAHANGFPAGSYQQLFNALPQDYQLSALERFGHNPRYPVNHNLANQVAELIDYVKNNCSQAVYLVGHSMGALVSYMAACEAPQYFKGVLMLDPPIVSGLARWMFKLAKYSPLIDRISPAGLAKVRCQAWPVETDMVDYFSHKALFRHFQRQCIADYVDAATEIRDGQRVLNFDAQIEAQIFRNVPHNIHRYYGRMTLPSCLVTAELSQVCVPANINHFKRKTGIAHQTFAGAGHMFPLEQPEAVAELIVRQIDNWQQTVG